MHRVKAPIGLTALSVALAALAACSGSPQQPTASTHSVVTPERGNRGNPPFYEVAGKRYYVLDSSDGFRERGIASWYGRDFHGRSTSSGEVYDMNQMTAAHKTLPIPTWVEVTNLVNGRRVIVKVNDRGPFVDGRIIDLSQRAAQELGMIQSGTARVQVRALGAPDAGPATPAPVLASQPPPRPANGGGFSIISEARADTAGPDLRPFRPYYVQVGAFADRNNATRLAERLKDRGFANSFVLTTGDGRERLHRVRIGPIAADEYDRIEADLQASGVREARLVQDN
jgi:peptidoglycan lytic transglycosylase